MQKIKAFKRALALAAVLLMAGTAWAKQGGGPALSGDLSPNRDSVEVFIPVEGCTAVANHTYSIKAYIFQPSGRIFAIGIGVAPLTCQANPQDVPVTVNAFQGLTFKPGPATLLFQVLDTDNTDAANPVVTTVDENGSRVDLHP
jgi:hypothetical protein